MISREEVSHIARLARIALTGDELDRFTAELSDVIEMVDELRYCPAAAAADGDEPFGVLRPDVAAPGLTRQQLMRNAARSEAGCFVAPKTVEAE